MDSTFPALDRLDDSVDELEDDIIVKATPELLDRIYHLKHSVVELRRLLGAQRDVFQSLITHGIHLQQADMTLYYRDVYDHIVRQYETVDAPRLVEQRDGRLSVNGLQSFEPDDEGTNCDRKPVLASQFLDWLLRDELLLPDAGPRDALRGVRDRHRDHADRDCDPAVALPPPRLDLGERYTEPRTCVRLPKRSRWAGALEPRPRAAAAAAVSAAALLGRGCFISF